MKRILISHPIVSVLIIIILMGSSCQPSSNNSGNVTPSPSVQSSPPVNVNGQGSNANGNESKVSPAEIDNSVANADTAMIFKVDKEVLLRNKGAADFIRILSGLFRGGDLLRVGQQAIAWVTCPDGHICPLPTGDYTDCCHVTCAEPIQLGPSGGSETRVMMRKMDLPAQERQTVEIAELRIRQLGADDVTTQFLIANLYSSWKLTEANQEVYKLSEQLKDPAAQQKLDKLYVPMVRKTGDLYLKLDQKVSAEQSYKKAVELAPGARDEKEEAAANVSLGQLYEKTGQKEAAVDNLQKATVLYEKQGEVQKAMQTRRVITRVQRQ